MREEHHVLSLYIHMYKKHTYIHTHIEHDVIVEQVFKHFYECPFIFAIFCIESSEKK